MFYDINLFKDLQGRELGRFNKKSSVYTNSNIIFNRIGTNFISIGDYYFYSTYNIFWEKPKHKFCDFLNIVGIPYHLLSKLEINLIFDNFNFRNILYYKKIGTIYQRYIVSTLRLFIKQKLVSTSNYNKKLLCYIFNMKLISN